MPGRYEPLTWSTAISCASSGRLAQSVAGALAATSAATAVPHEPAPITATLVTTPPPYAQQRLRAIAPAGLPGPP